MILVRIPIAAWFVFAAFSFSAFGERGLSKTHESYYDYLTSSEFSGSHSIRLINPTVLGEKAEQLTPACLITSVFNPKPGIDADEVKGGHYCLAKDGVCEAPLDCARRELLKEYADGHAARVEVVASLSESEKNKYDDECWEASGVKDRRGVLQFLDGQQLVQEVCTVSYICKNKPKPSHAACLLTTEVVTVGGTTQTKKVCPQLNDCINNDLTVPGYTKKEFDALLPTEQERARRQYETGVEEPVSAVKKVSSTLPRQAGAAGRPVDGHSK